tara:strand:- start:236 stop:436 length:201 start_codon:yes stop_codon:yes gene_type:complete
MADSISTLIFDLFNPSEEARKQPPEGGFPMHGRMPYNYGKNTVESVTGPALLIDVIFLTNKTQRLE